MTEPDSHIGDEWAAALAAARKIGFYDGLTKGFVEGLKTARNVIGDILHDPLTAAEILGVYDTDDDT